MVDKYKQIVKEGKPFIDKEFPPEAKSIADPVIDASAVNKFKELKWQRVTEIFKSPKLIIGGTAAVDINQGQLGDCYFLTVLGAAANHKDPKVIHNLFYDKELSSVGAILVSLRVNGIETWILMDDYLPTRYNKPSFVHSAEEGEVWPCFIEKAWAKLHGSYARIESGQPANAALHILGVPGKTWGHDRTKDVVKKINEGFARNFLVFAISHSKGDREMHGVIKNHGYQVQKVYPGVSNPKVTLFQMRNPWGYHKYNGKYALDKPIWTAELKSTVDFNATTLDKGVFFISEPEFMDAYEYTSSVVEPNPSKYNHSTQVIIDFNQEKKPIVFMKFTLKEDLNCEN